MRNTGIVKEGFANSVSGDMRRRLSLHRVFLAAAFVCLMSVMLHGSFGPGIVSSAGADEAAAQEQVDLLSYVPSEVNMLFSFDMQQLLSLPFVVKAMEEADVSEMTALQERIEKYGLELKDYARRVVFFGRAEGEALEDGLFGFVISTAMEEEKFREILDAESTDDGVSYETVRHGDYDVYMISNFMQAAPEGAAMPSAEMPDKAAVAYLTHDTMMISGEAQIESVFANLAEGATLAADPLARLAQVDRSALLWGVFLKPDTAPADPENPFDDVSAVNFDLNLTGEEQQDFQFRLAAGAGSEESAQTMKMQVDMMAQMMLPMFFGAEPELAEKLLASISTEVVGSEMKFSILLQQQVIEALQEYIAEQQAQTQEQ